jgi:mono/diheme cytochrome c family protein
VDHASARGNGGDAVASALAVSARGSGQSYDPDARLYAGACLGCHYNAPPAPLAARPELALTSALRLPEPDDLIHVVLDGIGLHEGGPGLTMPNYGSGLSNQDVARIAAYLRRSRTQLPAWHDLQKKVADIRQQPASQ